MATPRTSALRSWPHAVGRGDHVLQRLVPQLGHDGAALERVRPDGDAVDRLVRVREGRGAPGAGGPGEGDVEEGGDGDGEEEGEEEAAVGDRGGRRHGGHGRRCGGGEKAREARAGGLCVA